MFKIMIVEDDFKLRELIAEHFEKWGYIVRALNDQELNDVMAVFTEFEPHLVLMDINLSHFDGFYWCDKIRQISKVPVVFISARDSNMDIVMAMNLGGDDFINKPFSIEVLNAKVQAIIRRTYDYAKEESSLIAHNGVILDLSKQSLTYKESQIELSRNEFLILQLLLKHKGKILSKNFIIKYLWKDESYINENALAVNISRIRTKLKTIGLEDFIETKVGKGYVIK